ncbi:hypothetical protein CKF43_09335 [Pantoea graminicola]|uniref:hypothetical protein n=1 Tax=Pantoea sp. ARC607 TaxID=2027922 RepID=UPI000DA6E1D2|nr:hypothetical protein [Pantoea sp. ARC607]PZL95120.1 hypothetical protein CKF43_09335 [Pantoea sp. ARC607]
MKWILLAGALLSAAATAGDRSFETPEVRCLNDHTIPFIKSEVPPKEIVDKAYVVCKPELDEWKRSQEHLPDEMKQRMRKELYDFFLRMIGKRRNYEINTSATAAH